MANKKITDLQLISALAGTESFPLDDSIQTYRATLQQLFEWILATGNIETTMLADGILTADADGRAKVADGFLTLVKLAAQTRSNTERKNYALDVSVGSNALTIALKTAANANPSASDPVTFAMRSATATSGLWNLRTVSAALSVTIPSGTTLGSMSGVAQRYHVYAIDNDGTIELAVCGSRYYRDSDIVTSVAISGGSDGTVLYSTNARTSKPVLYIGSFVCSQATAGTWASAPSSVLTGQDRVSEDQCANSTLSTAPNDNSYVGWSDTQSLILTPGLWELGGTAMFSNNGSSPQYTNCALVLATANGANTSSQPSSSGITFMSGNGRPYDSGSGVLGSASYVYAPLASTGIVITVTRRIYWVPYVKGNATGNGRVQVFPTARKMIAQ